MESVVIWSLLIGVVFLLAGLAKGPLQRLPFSMTVVYLLIGLAISPWGLGLLDVSLLNSTKVIEIVTEIGVLVSLLTAGLKLAPSLGQLRSTCLPLATVTMTVTIAGVAAVGYFWLGLPIGAAVLLGAILAPTDPVLASEVQVEDHDDRDQLRYALTGEAGLNDGAAFPFIMLGLGLLGLHEIGDWGWRWVAVDLVWAVVGGLASGWICGLVISRLTVAMKRKEDISPASEELLTLGLIGVSYGVAMALHTYGFLAVFAAGLAVRRDAESDDRDSHADELMRSVTSINQQFGELLEVALVVLIGALLANHWSLTQDWWIALVLFFIIRPVATLVANVQCNPLQKGLIAFFGIRGIGSVYYLAYAIGKGMDEELALRLSSITLAVITYSLLLHSNLASTLLSLYRKRSGQALSRNG